MCVCSRTDSPPSRCVKPLYWTMFYQHFTMHCFYQFLLMSSIFTRILSLAHLFYAYFTHGPNKSASAQYDNTRGAWLTQEGCTITERKEGRCVSVHNLTNFCQTLSFRIQTSRKFCSHSKIPIRCLWTAFCVPLSFIFYVKQ